jgi:transposase
MASQNEFHKTDFMTPNPLLQHERVDDIPLLIGLMQQLHLPELLEDHLGSHHLHQGLSNGWLAAVWMAFILSESNHCKVSVQDWARSHQHTLQTLCGQPLRDVDFSDDRLSIVLRRFAEIDWTSLEKHLWTGTCEVYQIVPTSIRLDATTSCGYHTVNEGGLMQHGHSKDHRPDLPQLKLMAAAAQPSGQLIACDIVPGNAADDPLYVPLIGRVRGILGQKGLLYVGDCKMAALATRADVVAHDDYYLMPLPLTGETQTEFAGWIESVVTKRQAVVELQRVTEDDEIEVFALGYEFERVLTTTVHGESVSWTERVQVIQPQALAAKQSKALEERLRKAEAEVRALTPTVGRGQRQYRDERLLREAISAILEQHQVSGLLSVQWQREEKEEKRYKGRGRGGANRATQVLVKVRYQIERVEREEKAIELAKARLGWRVQVTNRPNKDHSLLQCVLTYNEGWSLERDFHLFKDVPLGIRPLYVREEDQIIGLTRLLTIALRVLTLFELRVRAGLSEAKEELAGLYEGQPNRKTDRPTGARLLKAIARLEITIVCLDACPQMDWHLTKLSPLLLRVLELVNLSPELYTRLIGNSE